jgi:hypothetical protein
VAAGALAAAGRRYENLAGVKTRKQCLPALDFEGLFAGVDIESANAVIYQEAFGDHQAGRKKYHQARKRKH